MRTFKTYKDMNKAPEIGDIITTAVGATYSMGVVTNNTSRGVSVKFMNHDNPRLNGSSAVFPEDSLSSTYGPMVEDNMDSGHRDPEYLTDLEDAFESFEYNMDVDPDQDDQALVRRLSGQWGVEFNDLANRIIKSRYS